MRYERPQGIHRWQWVGILASVFLALTPLSLKAQEQSKSSVRIVRLSFVEGTVTMHQPGVDGWAKAFINSPIQQGFQIATPDNSFAEIEFENGSTARLGEGTELDFTELSLASDGSKVNRMSLTQGYATFSVTPDHEDIYEIKTPQGTFTADGKSTFRVDLNQNDERLEVFKGSVQVQSSYGSGTVAKNDVLEIQPGDSDSYQISSGITTDAWDKWVNQRNGQVTEASNGISGSQNPYSAQYSSMYGWNDLSYYGNWTNLPGYGYGWMPFNSAGWMPYTLGQWGFYPGLGYTWISSEPWGWLPFHYGNWINVPGSGWAWMPGNFGPWSPGLVTWYQGPGWVGWYPNAGGFRTHGQAGCAAGQNCVTAVNVKTFAGGGLITPNTLVGVNPGQGRAVSSPAVQPATLTRLPRPVLGNHVFFSRHTGSTANTNAFSTAAPRRVFPTRPEGFSGSLHTASGITFNPMTHRYENGSAAFSGSNTGQAGAGVTGGGRSQLMLQQQKNANADSSNGSSASADGWVYNSRNSKSRSSNNDGFGPGARQNSGPRTGSVRSESPHSSPAASRMGERSMGSVGSGGAGSRGDMSGGRMGGGVAAVGGGGSQGPHH